MKYFEDMTDKGGFSDGAAMPPGVELYREVYVRLINKFAEQYGSKVRAAAYDRGGIHNGCLIVMIPAHMAAEYSNLDAVLAGGASAMDDAMHTAIQVAMEADADDMLHTVVTLSPDFEQWLENLE